VPIKTEEGKMSIQAAEIGSLNGFGITQMDAKRATFVKETVMEAKGEKIVFRMMVDAERVFGYETMSITDDLSIRNMLKRISLTDVIVALIDADQEAKEAIYRNLTEQAKEYVKTLVYRLETGNTRELMIERSRNMISEAFVELIR
jgi:hypothetical protein